MQTLSLRASGHLSQVFDSNNFIVSDTLFRFGIWLQTSKFRKLNWYYARSFTQNNYINALQRRRMWQLFGMLSVEQISKINNYLLWDSLPVYQFFYQSAKWSFQEPIISKKKCFDKNWWELFVKPFWMDLQNTLFWC